MHGTQQRGSPVQPPEQAGGQVSLLMLPLIVLSL